MDTSSVLWTNWHEQLEETLDRHTWTSEENVGLLRAGHRLIGECSDATGSRNLV